MSKLREFILRMVLIVASLLFVCGAAELSLRAALFVEVLPSLGLRSPWRYADADLDDEFWKLTYLFSTAARAQAVGYVDPELGWDTRPTPEDPLGIHAAEPYNVENFVKPILFYGDSFVGGTNNIPRKLDLLLSHRPVLNFGVGGYGLDQIYLKFSKTAQDFENPLVLIGILTYDLDRSVLGIRTHQKPYFDIEDGALILRNTPVLPSTQAYIDQNPIEINSYFLRFVLLQLREFIRPSWFNSMLGYTENEQKKRTINRAILHALKEKAAEIGVRPYAVLFYSGEEIDQPTWRETFLKENLTALNIDYFDTRTYLLDYMATTGTSLDELYREDYGHLNQDGRWVVARGLAEWVNAIDAVN